jgi:hypothetical protein
MTFDSRTALPCPPVLEQCFAHAHTQLCSDTCLSPTHICMRSVSATEWYNNIIYKCAAKGLPGHARAISQRSVPSPAVTKLLYSCKLRTDGRARKGNIKRVRFTLRKARKVEPRWTHTDTHTTYVLYITILQRMSRAPTRPDCLRRVNGDQGNPREELQLHRSTTTTTTTITTTHTR